MVLSWGLDCSFDASGGSLFGFSDGDIKFCVGSRTTHLTSHKFYFWIDGNSLLSYQGRDYLSMNDSKKDR